MPWTKRPTSDVLAPARSSTACTASSTPADWSSGVLGAFAVTSPSGAASTASVKVPPTSTPRTRSGSHDLRRTLEVVLEVLVGRAVLAARERHALARGALAGSGVAAQRAAVERDARAGVLVDVPDRELHVALDDGEHAQLAADREEHADLVEQRARGTREVVAVGGEPLHRGLARAQHLLAV